MAKILLGLSDEKIQAKAQEALAETRHTLVPIDAPGALEAPEKIAALISSQTPDVVVMDYHAEDAASIKLIQLVTDMVQKPEFIFIDSDDTANREQVLMALNEGARAFLSRDFQPASFRNYVERAISGPGRLRLKTLENYGSETTIHHLEEQLGSVRTKAASYQRLISHLLATPNNAQARKVLLVSDSPYQLELLKKTLTEHNFNTLTASTSAAGLNLALSERPRIVISDLELDNETGVELCQAIKFTHKLMPTYFVICTANQDKISKVMTPGNGVDDCLIKPSGQNDTVDFISRVALGLLL